MLRSDGRGADAHERKANRSLRQETGTLNSLTVAYGDKIDPSAYEVLSVELAKLISDSDLHMTALALELCCTLMADRSSPAVGLTVGSKDLPQALTLIKSSLRQLLVTAIPDFLEKGLDASDSVAVEVENSELREDVLDDEKQKWKREVEEKLQVLGQQKHNLVQVLKQALQKYFASLVYSANTSFDASLESLSSAKPSPQTGGVAKQALRSIAQCVAVLCLAADDQQCSSAVNMLTENLKHDASTNLIFCAKCGSKDVYADNGDGACDQGFHQHCLEPPLLSEESNASNSRAKSLVLAVLSDKDAWLCPGCDCKVDCTDLLNHCQGTDLTVTDSWMKVCPEAVTAASAGQNQENNQGIPSDDSDDSDYDPDGLEAGEEVQLEESSSDASASDGLGTLESNDEQYLGFPSDDSVDDDFNPDSLDTNENIKQESSSSDFTADSEDLAAALDDDIRSSENVECPQSSSLGGSRLCRSSGERISVRGQKRRSLEDELSVLEPGADQDGLTPVSGLDCKKLPDVNCHGTINCFIILSNGILIGVDSRSTVKVLQKDGSYVWYWQSNENMKYKGLVHAKGERPAVGITAAGGQKRNDMLWTHLANEV